MSLLHIWIPWRETSICCPCPRQSRYRQGWIPIWISRNPVPGLFVRCSPDTSLKYCRINQEGRQIMIYAGRPRFSLSWWYILFLYKLLVKLSVKIIEVLFVQFGFNLFQRLPETLEMNHFPGAQEFKGFTYFRVFDDTDQVIIGGPGLLLWGDLVSTTYTKI